MMCDLLITVSSIDFYVQVKKDYAQFYKYALKFLGYTKLEELPENEASSLALKLGVAALLGKGVYNFGDFVCYHSADIFS